MAEEAKCPVDHKSREVWTKAATSSTPASPTSNEEAAKCPVDHTKWAEMNKNTTATIDGSKINTDYEPRSHLNQEEPVYETNINLPTEREVSSIPRTGTDSNWIYPSQKQFYEAMKRKNWETKADDMTTVVPIHNAVNERVWYQILKWEENQGGEKCGGLQLTSFKGDSKKLTPKALFWSLFGFTKPFDRHDWTINRCGVEVDYVIDFYQGRENPKMPGMASFYLDVRPKLNSYEGFRLRIAKFFGL